MPHRRIAVHTIACILILAGIGFGTRQAAAQGTGLTTVDLNSGLTPTDLVNGLSGVVGGPTTISNATYTGANTAAGTFTGGNGILGFFEQGIVLSTGNIASVVGPNSVDSASTVNGTPGDPALDTLSGGVTSDAAVLDFDFTCPGGPFAEIAFEFVFTSEEYNERVNAGFNDSFGIFLNGVNLALLPNNIDPISVDTLNCGNPFNPPLGGSNCALFINNDCNDMIDGTFPCAGNRNTEMDGLSVVMFATGLLIPGTNHIKLAIADAGDSTGDSAVFILVSSMTCSVNDDVIPRTLKTVPIPQPDNLFDFVKNQDAAIALGKSLFWDMQVGSDGVQACATCHHQAGADGRMRNALHPGPNGTFQVGGPNYTLQASDFPFINVGDPLLNDDIVGSQGVVRTDFLNIVPGSPEDTGNLVPDPVHQVGGINTRQMTGRQAPSVINAVFHVKNFWDGRANFVFNGVNPFGLRDPGNPTILEVQPDGTVIPASAQINKASLASQAVGPALSEVEMSWNGRSFAELGQKLLSLRPLAKQIVDPSDSVLGIAVHPSGKGLDTTYQSMIQDAFLEQFWDSPTLTPEGFTVMEANFSLFFGLAIQEYESTLVSYDSPFDHFREGQLDALTDQQKLGLSVFVGEGRCIRCHGGAEFTNATLSRVQGLSEHGHIETMAMGNGLTGNYDNGFYNIGVRPTTNDPGTGGTDPFGNPLSFTRLAYQGIEIGPPFDNPPGINTAFPAVVDGSFKVPSLRNVELTAPYFHNGGAQTLQQVVDFYARGGDFADLNAGDLAVDILPLPLSALDRSALVAFLHGLTDERVRLRQAPFDHPQLFVANGHIGDDLSVTDNGTGAAVDCMVEIPAVGAAGAPPFTMPEECLDDCNGNGNVDSMDIAEGISGDCDINGIPDECELDSDGDGVIDVCDNCANTPNADQADCDGDGIGDVCADVRIALVVRRTQSVDDTATSLPVSDNTVIRDTDFVIELWATDSGAVNTGLIGVFANLSFPPEKMGVMTIDHRPPFNLLESGTFDNFAGTITDLGGNDATLTGQGIDPNWARVAVVQFHAFCDLMPADFGLSPSTTEVSAFARGSIPPSEVSFCGANVDLIFNCIYDKDESGEVNSGDLALFAPAWLTGEGDPGFDPNCDFDCSGMIGAGDLGWLATSWLQSCTDLSDEALPLCRRCLLGAPIPPSGDLPLRGGSPEPEPIASTLSA